MAETVSKLRAAMLIAGAALSIAACGAKDDENAAAETTSLAEPHGSLGAAAEIMTPKTDAEAKAAEAAAAEAK
jgi:hypothetical protein